MITKKKGFCLGLLLSMLGISGAMQAYVVTIKNSTPYSVKIRSKYSYGPYGALTESRVGMLPPKGKMEIRNPMDGDRYLSRLFAWVYQFGMKVEPIAVNPYRITRYPEGDELFVVEGKKYARGEKVLVPIFGKKMELPSPLKKMKFPSPLLRIKYKIIKK